MFRVVLLLLVSYTIATGALADDCLVLELVGDSIDLSMEPTTQRIHPAVAYNHTDNEYMAVWLDSRNPGENDIYGQRVAADGMLEGGNFAVITAPESQSNPALAYNGSTNQYLAAWKTQQPGYFNKGRGRIINADGALPGADFLLGNGHENSIAYNSQSTEYLHTARSPSIKGRRVSAAGAPIGAEILIESAGAPAPNGQVAYDSNNNRFLATWRDQVNEDLRGRLIGADGSLLAPSFIIWPGYPASGRAASLAFDAANDRYLVVFGVFQETDILGQFVASDGTRVGEPFVIESGLAFSTDPYCAFSAASEIFAVVWRDGGGVMARVVAADGTVGSEALELVASTAIGSPRITHNSTDDQFFVVWPDSRNSGMGEEDIYGQRIACQTASGIAASGAAPRGIALGDARPNPFRNGTRLEITLDEARSVELVVWDVAGREVRRLVDGVLAAGTHERRWDGRDAAGRAMPAGIYFARLSAGETRAETKVLRLR